MGVCAGVGCCCLLDAPKPARPGALRAETGRQALPRGPGLPRTYTWMAGSQARGTQRLGGRTRYRACARGTLCINACLVHVKFHKVARLVRHASGSGRVAVHMVCGAAQGRAGCVVLGPVGCDAHAGNSGTTWVVCAGVLCMSAWGRCLHALRRTVAVPCCVCPAVPHALEYTVCSAVA